jgi:hypothetical protein
MATHQRIIAALLLASFTGCASVPSGQTVVTTQAVTMQDPNTPGKTITTTTKTTKTKEEFCSDQASEQTEGWRIATWTGLGIGAFFWPLLVVPAVTGIVSLVASSNAKTACMAMPSPDPSAITTTTAAPAPTVQPVKLEEPR